MSAIARWCCRHRLVAIATWVVVLIGLSILAQAIKSDYNNSFSLPGTGSTTAQQLLAKASPGLLVSRSRLSGTGSPASASGCSVAEPGVMMALEINISQCRGRRGGARRGRFAETRLL